MTLRRIFFNLMLKTHNNDCIYYADNSFSIFNANKTTNFFSISFPIRHLGSHTRLVLFWTSNEEIHSKIKSKIQSSDRISLKISTMKHVPINVLMRSRKNTKIITQFECDRTCIIADILSICQHCYCTLLVDSLSITFTFCLYLFGLARGNAK